MFHVKYGDHVLHVCTSDEILHKCTFLRVACFESFIDKAHDRHMKHKKLFICEQAQLSALLAGFESFVGKVLRRQ